MTSPAAAPDDERHNVKINALNGMLKGAGGQLVNPFLGINAIRLGAPNIDLGIISAIPYLAGGIAALLSPWLVHRKRLHSTTIGLFLAARLSILLFALIDFRHGIHHAALWFMLAIVWSNLPGALATLSWQSMTTSLFSGAVRSSAVMWRQWGMSSVGVVAVLLGGWAIDKNPGTHGYITLYVIGTILGIAEVAVYRRFKPGPKPLDLPNTTWSMALPHVWDNLRLRRFILAGSVFYCGWLMLWPASLRYQVSIDHASNFWMALYTAVNAIFTLAALPIWRRLTSRLPTERLLPWASLLMCLTPAIYLLHPGLGDIVWANVTGGIAGAGFNLLINVRLMEVVPDNWRTMAVGANTVATGIAGGVGALLAVLLIHVGSLMSVFLAATAIRAIGGALFSWASTPQSVSLPAQPPA
ncbi:MFS transporter [Sulfobacillus harzensis]|uniref:MFS transporter n=1 Tax=Sulfobacillus harzensis TaxID=2729629 RepID=A0A7Y0Q3J9_9FIRM|nr:MFS transporter [Sulfobacillus harzensis]NMP23056.1 MFS transporter [Sulfobacillus harzensis]